MRRRARSASPTRILLVTLWQADPRRTLVLGACVLAGGILPGVLMVASGRVVAAIEAAAGGAGTMSPTPGLWATAVFVAASLAYAGAGYAGAVAEAGLSRRLLQTVEDLLARAVLGPPTITHLEDPAIAGRIATATEASRENVYYWALPALVRSTTLRITGLVSGCVLFGFGWWSPLLLFAGYAVLLRATTAGCEPAPTAWPTRPPPAAAGPRTTAAYWPSRGRRKRFGSSVWPAGSTTRSERCGWPP